jgi:ATP:cob(I)alamin adenosyltransferase
VANIYTKTGDKGETSLFGGKRVSKNSLRVECYGTIDEANSMLGLAYAQTEKDEIKNCIKSIQEKLFIIAAELASDEKGLSMLEGKVASTDIEFLENTIDKCYAITGKQTAFVIPGINKASSLLHVARTIVRRAERRIISLKDAEIVREELLKYINRLSDTIYALARLEETYEEIDKTKERALEIIMNNMKSNSNSKFMEENNKEIEFNLRNIKILVEFAEEKAKEMNVPIVFSAVDAGGNLLLLHRMEDSLLASIDISINKAFTANALKQPTHNLAKQSNPNNELYGIQNTNHGRIVVFGGGFPYVYKGKIVGAIGISGGSVEEDMQIGLYALGKFKKGEELI